MAAGRGAGGIIFSPDAQAAKSRTASNLESMANAGRTWGASNLRARSKFGGVEGANADVLPALPLFSQSLLVVQCHGTEHLAYTHPHDLKVRA
jgi:hypothetical protein